MSGFVGVLRADGQGVPHELLEQLAGALRFRGTTGERIWTHSGAGTCFSYLRTGFPDRSTSQPVILDDHWLLGDIRLDGRAELIERLGEQARQITADSPSAEILLRAWLAWGEGCLPQLVGDYSFAVYNGGDQSLWCARDFAGPRPFYYAHVGGNFYFSNTLAALNAVPEISSQLDEAFVADFLLDGYCADPERTIYAGIRRLPAGHLLKFQQQSVEVRRFLTLPLEDALHFARPEEYLEAYREVVGRAVRDRLPKGPVALYLSGGLDSGTVCAIAAQITEAEGALGRLKAFTVSWRPLFADPEPDFAILTAQHLQLRHEILDDPGFQLFTPGETGRPAIPEPTVEAFFARAQRQTLRIAAHSNVVLSGDGGDDVLTGQSWPYFKNLWSAGEWSKIATTLGGFAWSHGSLPPFRMGLRAKMRGLLGPPKLPQNLPEWFEAGFVKRNRIQQRQYPQVHHATDIMRHPTHPQAYQGLHQGFWASILEEEDSGFAGVPLEVRAPLLDLRVLRFLLRVPPVPWCINKELARRAMQPALPAAITRRPKTALVRNPLEACLESEQWLPKLPPKAPAGLEEFIDWQKWRATFASGQGLSTGPNLFSLAFVMWLKDVENAREIE